MTTGERIKILREKIGITQEEFSQRLGTTRNTITNYEANRRMPMDATIKSICREFNVSEAWLRTGEGEMFVPKEADALDELVKQYGLSDGDHVLIEKFLKLKPAERQAVISYMQEVVAALNAGTALPAPERAEPDTSRQQQTEVDADGLNPVSAEFEAEARAKAELYYQQLLSEQEQAKQASSAKERGAG